MNSQRPPHDTRSPDYAVIIPAFNEEAYLPGTLSCLERAIAGNASYSAEVIVVDNNSTDRTADVARSHHARVVSEPINRIARARNCGGRAARADWLIFVDADTLVSADLLGAALDQLSSGKVCGGGARVWSSDPVTRSACRAMRLWNRLAKRFRLAAGSFVFCTRGAWQETGGFDERVYASEELYFSRALKRYAKRHGQEMVILPLAVDTSMRKLRWYTTGTILRMILGVLLCPFLLRSKRFCRFWYERPGERSKGSAQPPPSSHR